jgi:hypothetical protein
MAQQVQGKHEQHNSPAQPGNRCTLVGCCRQVRNNIKYTSWSSTCSTVQQFNTFCQSHCLTARTHRTTTLINRKEETNTITPTCPPLANVFFPSLPSTVGPPSPFPPLPRNTWSQYLPFPIRPCTKGLVLDQTRHCIDT